MSDPLHVVCPHCDAVNRLPSARLAETPVCGKCGQALFAGQPIDLNAGNFDRHIGRSDLPVVVDFWDAVVWPLSQHGTDLRPRCRRTGTDGPPGQGRQDIKRVKLVKQGDVGRALTVRGIGCTEGAKAAIVAAGGSVE